MKMLLLALVLFACAAPTVDAPSPKDNATETAATPCDKCRELLSQPTQTTHWQSDVVDYDTLILPEEEK